MQVDGQLRGNHATMLSCCAVALVTCIYMGVYTKTPYHRVRTLH